MSFPELWTAVTSPWLSVLDGACTLHGTKNHPHGHVPLGATAQQSPTMTSRASENIRLLLRLIYGLADYPPLIADPSCLYHNRQPDLSHRLGNIDNRHARTLTA
jgi:hypothetical protein